jgi:hypothetical protein
MNIDIVKDKDFVFQILYDLDCNDRAFVKQYITKQQDTIDYYKKEVSHFRNKFYSMEVTNAELEYDIELLNTKLAKSDLIESLLILILTWIKKRPLIIVVYGVAFLSLAAIEVLRVVL